MKNMTYLLIIAIQQIHIIKIHSQIIFQETFQSYNVSPSQTLYTPFNGTWYRADVPKSTGQFKIKGSTSKIASKFMSVFAESASSRNCLDIVLDSGAVYELRFDHTWEGLRDFGVGVGWNGVEIFGFFAAGYGNQGVFLSFAYNLSSPILAINNTLCFYGTNLNNPGARIGPSIDNVIITLISASQISNYTNTTNSTNSTTQTQNTTNSSNQSASTNTTTNNTTTVSNTTNSNITNNINISNITSNTTNNTNIILNITNSTTGNATNNTTNNTTNNNSNNNTNNISSNISQSQNNSDWEFYNQEYVLKFVHMEWVVGFGFIFNRIVKFTSFFGFAYLLSNLLNFWNLIVLYYFLDLSSFIQVYRMWLKQLCKICLQSGSILTLLSHITPLQQPQPSPLHLEKMPQTSTKWQSFYQMGFTSQFSNNNLQLFIIFFFCIFKLIVVNAVKFVVRRCKWKGIIGLFQHVKVNNRKIFCYEIVANLPTMLVPFGVLCSRFSNCGSNNFSQKLNLFLLMLSLLIFLTVALIPILLQQKPPKLPKPITPIVKSTIFLYSQLEIEPQNQKQKQKQSKQNKENKKHTIRLENFKQISGFKKNISTVTTQADSIFNAKVNFRTVKFKDRILKQGGEIGDFVAEKCQLTKKTKQQISYRKRLSTYYKQIRFYKHLSNTTSTQLLDNSLYFLIPYLLSFQQPILFLIPILLFLLTSLAWLIHIRHSIRQFNHTEFFFNVCIKVVMLLIHIMYIMLYLHQTGIVVLGFGVRGYLGFFIIAGVIVGLFVEVVHCGACFFKWFIEVVRHYRADKQQKKILNHQQHINVESNFNNIHKNQDQVNQGVQRHKSGTKIQTQIQKSIRKSTKKTRKRTRNNKKLQLIHLRRDTQQNLSQMQQKSLKQINQINIAQQAKNPSKKQTRTKNELKKVQIKSQLIIIDSEDRQNVDKNLNLHSEMNRNKLQKSIMERKPSKKTQRISKFVQADDNIGKLQQGGEDLGEET